METLLVIGETILVFVASFVLLMASLFMVLFLLALWKLVRFFEKLPETIRQSAENFKNEIFQSILNKIKKIWTKNI